MTGLLQRFLRIDIGLTLGAGFLAMGLAFATPLLHSDLGEQIRQRVMLDSHLAASEQVTVTPLKPVVLPEGAVVQGVETLLDGRFSTRTIVRLKLQLKDGQSTTRMVPVAIEWRRPVWVVTQPVQPGEALTPAMVQLQSRPVGLEAEHFLSSGVELKQYEARVPLRPGSVLDDRQVRIRPLVRADQRVRIVVRTAGGVTVAVDGKALQDGALGQSVQVKQLQFKPVVHHGVVTGAGVVTVAR